MRVGVLTRSHDPTSLRIYREHITARLGAEGVTPVAFAPDGPLPGDCNVIWDPGLGMRRVPGILGRVTAPLVVTCHGVRTHSVPLRQLTATWPQYIRERARQWLVTRQWRRLAGRVDAVITVSRFAADEAIGAFGLPAWKVHAIHHGYDRAVFTSIGDSAAPSERPYLLHVSSGAPIKNIPRLLEAYARLPEADRPDLLLVISEQRPPRRAGVMPHVRVIDAAVPHAHLATLYRHAVGFVFPSLRESFGLPIIEAMASGCPVITSDGSACAEIAADAALRVDPRSVDALADAMRTLYTDTSVRRSLIHKGLQRADRFSWDTSAAAHAEVFRQVATRQP